MTAPPPLVLNVNDHVANLYMVSKMLRNAGFRVAEARTGSDALAKARTPGERPEVIVLDVQLPDLSGFEVCRRLKSDAETADIKILHTSAAMVTANNKAQGVEAGADGYLTQPFEPQELIATVRSLARLHATESDLIARNDALMVADRRKDEFLAMLAHELRNPLAAIQTGLPLLERFAAHDEIERRAREVLRRQTGLLIQLVDDLLDVSRVTRNRIELHRAELDLARLVGQVCDGFRPRVIEPRGQTLVVDVPVHPVRMSGDAGRLEQVLTNLLDNASKYSDATTRIEVALVVDGGRATLSVRDHGIGIDASTLPQVFDLFAQAQTSLDRARGGLGIGLTLVKALVELHGGDITASSPGLGHGTTMTVRLPVHAGAAAVPAPAARRPTPLPTAARSVLVVDDNTDGREMLRCLCELLGHRVVEAADGEAGVAQAVEHRPDIAFIDIGLPTIDGYEVARRVRAALGDRAPRLVALSGYGSEQHRAAAIAAGFDLHIAKPIDADKLRRELANVTPRG
ncbi:MAG TPA: response regulator [Kofleriaceae bacterium]|nr:response regulator [Kofleriaceae bacterium]